MAKGKSSIANMLSSNSIQKNTAKEKQRLDQKLELERTTEQVKKVKTSSLSVDPVYEKNIRPQRREEAEQFKELIKVEGIRDALVVYEENGEPFVIDGHHRLKAAKELGIEFVPIKVLPFVSKSEAIQWMLRNQLGRRNLTDAERIDIALVLEGEIREQAKENLSAGGKGLANLPKVNTREEVAKLSNTSSRNVGKYKKIKDEGSDKLVEQVLRGEKSIHKAYTEVVDKLHDTEDVKSKKTKARNKSVQVKFLTKKDEAVKVKIEEIAQQKGKKEEEVILEVLRRYFK